MKRAALALLLSACLSTIGCTGSEQASYDSGRNAEPVPSGSNGSNGSNDPGRAAQAIEEADIVQIQGGRLFAISKSGTLSVIDVSTPGHLALDSQVLLPGEPFEMYLNGSRLVLLMNESSLANGQSVVLVLDVRDPMLVQRIGTFPVTGTIDDSRLLNDVLYLVTEDRVATFDLTTASSLAQVDQLPLSTGKHSVLFGNGRMYVGGQAGIDLVDVSDPKGKLQTGTHVDTAGPITARWQMSEKDDVLRVVTQPSFDLPEVETFAVWNSRSMQPMATMPVQLPIMEDLKAVRFDEDRAYLITFRETDPLFVVDLADPSNPRQRGELEMPGWVVHLEPRGNRLIGLGVDPSDTQGKINVSLFDVSDMDRPVMLERVKFGQTIELAEDQDRLQKAFRIGADGLITIPYSGPVGASCDTGGAIQLVKLDNDTLYRGQNLPMAGNPRRALVNQNELIGVSDSNVSAFDIASAARTADVRIGECEIRVASNESDNDQNAASNRDTWNGYYGDDQGSCGFFGCSTSRGSSTGGAGVALGFVVVVGSLARRRASRRAA